MQHPDPKEPPTLAIESHTTPSAPLPAHAHEGTTLVAGLGRHWLFSGIASLAVLAVIVLLLRALSAYGLAPVAAVPRPTATQAVVDSTSTQDAGTSSQPIYNPVNVVSISMVSADDVWAVGADPNQPNGPVPVFLHFDGARWRYVPTNISSTSSPSISNIPMVSVSMVSSHEGWAVGGDVIAHYDGTQWVQTSVDISGQSVALNSVQMVSRDEGWAVGAAFSATNDGTQTPTSLILHFAHGQWTPSTLPRLSALTTLRALSMVSADEGWAVGSDYGAYYGEHQETGLALHYSHGTWQRVDVTIPGPLYGVSALASGEVWLAGASNPGTGPGFILRYRPEDGVWRVVPSPTPNILHAISMRSPSDGWIAGDGAAILRYDGVRWTQVSPTFHHVGLLSIAVQDGEGWAAGTNVVLRLHGGVWTTYALTPQST